MQQAHGVHYVPNNPGAIVFNVQGPSTAKPSSPTVPSRGPGLFDFAAEVARWLRGQEIATGLLTLFCRDTSALLLIQENFDPNERRDLEAFFTWIAPESSGRDASEHDRPGDMPAHRGGRRW
jgi:thiamine phosphate synthase YjbQ (UPF0047 family)